MNELSVQRHPKHSLQSGKVLLWVLLWMVGMALIGFLCVKQHIPNLEARIQSQVQTAIAPLHDTPLKVSVSGYTATLEGKVANAATEQRILSAAVEKTNARSVNNRLAIQPVIQTPIASAELDDNTPRVATNAVEAVSPESTVQPTAPPTPTVVELPIAPPAPSADLQPQAPGPTEQPSEPVTPSAPDQPAPPAPAADAQPAAPAVATTNTEVSSETLEAETPLEPALDTTEDSDASLPAPAPAVTPEVSALKPSSLQLSVTNNALRVSGKISESDNLGSMIDTAVDSLKVNFLIDELAAEPDTDVANWAAPLEALLPSLRAVKNLSLSINDSQINIGGSVQNEAVLNQLGTEAGRLFKDFSIANQLVVAANEPTASDTATDASLDRPPAENSTQDVTEAETSEENAIVAQPSDVLDDKASVQAEMNNLQSTRILFRSGSGRLTEESVSILMSIADILRRYPTVDVDIDGHTDAQGSTKSNLALSQARANSVRDFLVSEGISEFRIGAYGFGESLPITSNDTAEGRSINRRIEFNF